MRVNLALLLLLSMACTRPSTEPGIEAQGHLELVDRAAAVGLEFRHDNGMTGALYLAEIMGSGLALFDYDGDGDLDAFFPQGGRQGRDEGAPDRLFRNEFPPMSFRDVSEKAGFEVAGYGMGAAAGDFDRDGNLDLYVTNLGANLLWRNRGDGSFEEVTEASGAGDERWSMGASFLDIDRDGWLDLYIVNYVDFTFANHVDCRVPSGLLDYCGPQSYGGDGDRLLRNRGDGTFEDISLASGIGMIKRSGLGVVSGDFDMDGWIDIYVTNDGEPNFLWRNRGDGTFENTALVAGSAVNRRGEAEASMGVAPGDLDGDGLEDLFLTHLMRQTNTVYYGVGSGLFEDRTDGSGLGQPSLDGTGFGTVSVDLDRDGWLDIVLVNGGVTHIEALVAQGDEYPVHQTNQVFHNLGGRRFEDVTKGLGEALELSEVSRGLAAGDVDLDGDQDLLITNNLGPVRLLINESYPEGGWVSIDVQSIETGSTVLGSQVWTSLGKQEFLHTLRTDGSYCSATDPRAFIGLGHESLDRIEVRLPQGRRLVLKQPPTNRRLVFRIRETE